MEECISDTFEETGKGALKTDGKKHGRMLWRHVGEDVKVCRRLIGGNRKGCIRDKLHLHYKHLKETQGNIGRRHWKGIQGDTWKETRGRRPMET